MKSATIVLALVLGAAPAYGQAGLPLPQEAQRVRHRAASGSAPGLRGHVDWQAHPAAHFEWKFFRRGLTSFEPRWPKLTWNHTFRQTVHAQYLKRSGVRIFVAAALADRAKTRVEARETVLKQLAYVENFVRENPNELGAVELNDSSPHA